ncbi:MAG: 3-hydroxyacyl-CoA dehydrogenase NAD-binding domain-containing protein [Alphaproteobacteria bacterium]
MTAIAKGPVKHIALVGTGTIGAGFAAHFLARGYEISATDPAPGAEAKLAQYLARVWPQLREIGATDRADPPSFRFAASVADCVRGADFVQENAPETEAVKVDVLKEIDAALPPDRIIASSTSALLLSRIAIQCRHRARCILAHPFNPPHLVPLIELAGDNATAPEAIDVAYEFYEAAGLKPVRLNGEVFGHIANRIQYVVWNEVVRLVLQGFCTPADVDRAMIYGPGTRWPFIGPFATYALAGGEGGLAKTFKMFGPRDAQNTDRAARIQLTPEQQRMLIESVDAIFEGRSPSAVAAERDGRLVELIKLRKRLGLA